MRDFLTSWTDPSGSGHPLASRGGRRWSLALMACAVVFCDVGFASASSRLVGSDYNSRPLVLPKGVLRLDGGPRRPYSNGQVMPGGQLQFLINRDADDFAFLVPGAGYGVIDDLELGAVWPLQLSPELNLLDLSAYGKYSLQRGSVEVAAYAEVRVPIEADLELTGGIPVFVHLSDAMRLETGGFIRLSFADDTAVTLLAPVSLPIQVSPQVFVGPETGIEIRDFESVAIPLGVLAGYTLGGGISSIGDLFTRLTFADISHGADTIRFDVGAELFFDLL